MIVEPLGGQRVRMVFRDDDEDGDYTITSVSPPVQGCSIQPERPSESYDTGQQSRAPFRVFGPPLLSALRSWDALDLEIEPRSEVWVRATLTGPPGVWPDDTGALDHVELTVTHVAG